MKTMESLRKSLQARMDQMESEAAALLELIRKTNQGELHVGILAGMRVGANNITQCVHEISAYHNAIHTE